MIQKLCIYISVILFSVIFFLVLPNDTNSKVFSLQDNLCLKGTVIQLNKNCEESKRVLANINITANLFDGNSIETLNLTTNDSGQYFINVKKKGIYRLTITPKTNLPEYTSFLSIVDNFIYCEVNSYNKEYILPHIIYMKPLKFLNFENFESISKSKTIEWEKDEGSHFYILKINKISDDKKSIRSRSFTLVENNFHIDTNKFEKGNYEIEITSFYSLAPSCKTMKMNFSIK